MMVVRASWRRCAATRRRGRRSREVRRDEEDVRDRELVDVGEHPLGVEAVVQRAEATEEDRRHGEGEPRAVEHRGDRQRAVAWAVAAVLDTHGEERERPRAVRQQDALGRSGRAGRIGDRERVPLLEPAPRSARAGVLIQPSSSPPSSTIRSTLAKRRRGDLGHRRGARTGRGPPRRRRCRPAPPPWSGC